MTSPLQGEDRRFDSAPAHHSRRKQKMLGQNFLIDQKIADRIVAEASIEDGERILEIGPGADKRYQLSLRVVTLKAWQGHFSHNMFIRPNAEELEGFVPEFTILNAYSTDVEIWKELGDGI